MDHPCGGLTLQEAMEIAFRDDTDQAFIEPPESSVLTDEDFRKEDGRETYYIPRTKGGVPKRIIGNEPIPQHKATTSKKRFNYYKYQQKRDKGIRIDIDFRIFYPHCQTKNLLTLWTKFTAVAPKILKEYIKNKDGLKELEEFSVEDMSPSGVVIEVGFTAGTHVKRPVCRATNPSSTERGFASTKRRSFSTYSFARAATRHYRAHHTAMSAVEGARDQRVVAHPRNSTGGIGGTERESDADTLANGKRGKELGHALHATGG
ncbi:hypothetical protein FQR65_LT19843 [Abscondita terminalis]|nr:hypothetical protein FQR65_LT19843 [Abscondita terminalis]